MTASGSDLLRLQKQHLASLLEAIQRCGYFLNVSDSGLSWPLTGEYLSANKKDNDLFEALAAINERFSKLQDTLGSAMRHSLQLSGEQADSFMRVLAIFEKNGVLLSIADWQVTHAARNLAAHDYQTDYDQVAMHFNTLHGLKTELLHTAGRFIQYCENELGTEPTTADFASEFANIIMSK